MMPLTAVAVDLGMQRVPRHSLCKERAQPPLPEGTPVTVGSTAPLLLVPVLTMTTAAVTGTITVICSLLPLEGVPVGQRTDTIAIDVSKLPMVQPLVGAVTGQVHDDAALTSLTTELNRADRLTRQPGWPARATRDSTVRPFR